MYVRLEASPGSYNAADSTYTIDVTLQNLMTQILGTPDGLTGTGMRIFFQRPLEVTAGTGPIALDNADSTGVFLSAGQPYFIYPGALAPGSVSDARTWRFKMGPDVTEFYFGVLVQGDVQHPESLLLFRPWYAEEEMEGVVLGLWSAPGGEVFAVGLPGLLMRNPGSGWVTDASPTEELLWDVWGSSATDVFAVGSGLTVVHWDGAAWDTMDAGAEGCGCESFYGVWGSGPDDVWAVGDGGLIAHYDGVQWTAADTMPVAWLNGVWGSAANDVFAVGDGGAVFHYDGTGWSPMATGLEDPDEELLSVWGLSSTDVYATASYGMLHYDGTAWSEVPDLLSCPHHSVWGTSSDNLFAANDCGVMHYDGSTWAYMDPGGGATELTGTGPNSLLANTNGAIYRGTR